MPPDSYHTIETPVEAIYREKGSKFLSFAYPVSSEFDIKQKIDALKNDYFDAHHHCYAWMLGPDKTRFRSFDDGEPNHSAGNPILGRIRSADLTDILIVVVRYFGGVKRGVGGLISAYKAAADAVITKAHIIEKFTTEILKVTFDYNATSEILRVVNQLHLKIIEQNFFEQTTIVLVLTRLEKQKLLSRLEVIKAVGNDVRWQIES